MQIASMAGPNPATASNIAEPPQPANPGEGSSALAVSPTAESGDTQAETSTGQDEKAASGMVAFAAAVAASEEKGDELKSEAREAQQLAAQRSAQESYQNTKTVLQPAV